MVSTEAQRRAEALRGSATAAVLCEFLSTKLEQTKTALVSAPLDRVQQLQGMAAAYTDLINYFGKGRE